MQVRPLCLIDPFLNIAMPGFCILTTLQRITLMVVVEASQRVMYTQLALGAYRYVYYLITAPILFSFVRLTCLQAKGGYKTQRKRNPNKYLVQERERNQGKRRPR